MTARNAPCPCGSGKKFKRCHGLESPSDTSSTNKLAAASSAAQRGELDKALTLAKQLDDPLERTRFTAHLLMRRRKPGDLAQLPELLERWMALNPLNPEPWQLKTEFHLFEHQLDSAWQAFSGMQQLAPNHPTTHYFNAVLLQLSNRLEESLSKYKVTLKLSQADLAGAEAEQSGALAAAAAMQMCETASGTYPGSSAVQPEGLFDCQTELRILEQQLLAWEERAQPELMSTPVTQRRQFSNGWYNLGCAALANYTGDDRRVLFFDKALTLNPEHILARFNSVFSLNYSETAKSEEIFNAHQLAGQWLEHSFPATPRQVSGNSELHRPLRIAYLSADFREHSVAHFILPVLENHNRSRFQAIAYHNHGILDEVSKRVASQVSTFRQVHSMSDNELLQTILGDRIDILIDLNGLTENHRMVVLAMRAAPIQITWVGYPNTTGLSSVDYRIVDRYTDPPDYAQALSTEKLMYMPNVFSVFQAADDLPDVLPPPSLNTGRITFGSMNSMPKLNNRLLASWAKILHGAPDSRLLIKNFALAFESPRRALQEKFKHLGIDSARLQLTAPTPGKLEHLRTYQQVDISLDSFPYNGTTTTCESLIMGVPVVSRAGVDHRSRVGLSQLGSLKLDSLVASNENDYIDIAVRLAGDQSRLKSLRSDLRNRIQSSALMNASGFTRDLEERLEQAWMRQSDQEKCT